MITETYCVLKLVLTFASVGEILKCNDSNESYRAVLSLSYSRAGTLHQEVASKAITVAPILT